MLKFCKIEGKLVHKGQNNEESIYMDGMDIRMVVVAVLVFSGCFAKIIQIFLYNRLVEDSHKVADCNSELIKQIKLRYMNQIKLELPVQDAKRFVSRYIYQYSKIVKAVNVLDMLSLILMLAGIAINYEKQYFDMEVLFIAMFIYLSVGLLVNGDKKERIVINNIADYLVNNMNIRMAAREHRVQVKESLKADTEKLVVSEEDKPLTSDMTEKNNETEEKNVEIKENHMWQMNKDNAIIEEVLREFLQA